MSNLIKEMQELDALFKKYSEELEPQEAMDKAREELENPVSEDVDYPQVDFQIMVAREDYEAAVRALNRSNIDIHTKHAEGSTAVLGFNVHQGTGKGKPSLDPSDIIDILEMNGIAAAHYDAFDIGEPETLEVSTDAEEEEIEIAEAFYDLVSRNWINGDNPLSSVFPKASDKRKPAKKGPYEVEFWSRFTNQRQSFKDLQSAKNFMKAKLDKGFQAALYQKGKEIKSEGNK
jgi:hypothetical protein